MTIKGLYSILFYLPIYVEEGQRDAKTYGVGPIDLLSKNKWNNIKLRMTKHHRNLLGKCKIRGIDPSLRQVSQKNMFCFFTSNIAANICLSDWEHENKQEA